MSVLGERINMFLKCLLQSLDKKELEPVFISHLNYYRKNTQTVCCFPNLSLFVNSTIPRMLNCVWTMCYPILIASFKPKVWSYWYIPYEWMVNSTLGLFQVFYLFYEAELLESFWKNKVANLLLELEFLFRNLYSICCK